MAKPNYDRVKRQKEAMRKQKKQEKLLRKQARATEGETPEGETPADESGTPLPAEGEVSIVKLEP
jgi:hypothetical protein